MSLNLTVHDVNSRLIVAAAVVIPWFALRERILGASSGASVLLEWLGLIGLSIGISATKLRTPKLFQVPAALTAVVIVVLSIADYQDVPSAHPYPQYWWGFGRSVAMVAASAALVAAIILSFLRTSKIDIGLRKASISKGLSVVCGFIVAVWTLPTLIQPMDAWLNLGDATEKVLDEVMGWTVWNIPGVHTTWVSNSMLGLPLVPLSAVSEFGSEKLLIVVLYVNFLVLLVPFLMSILISRAVPAINVVLAFALSLISVSVSGSPGNSSVFQELSFLSRGLPPLLLGAVLILSLSKSQPIPQGALFSIGVLAGIVATNNLEYGVPAVVAASTTIYYSTRTRQARVYVTRFVVGLLSSITIAFVMSAMSGGQWMYRRLGIWTDVISGTSSSQSHNAGSWPPAFGLPTVTFVVGIIAIAAGRSHLQSEALAQCKRCAALSCTFFGVWVLAAAPYFLNGGGAGAFRTQFLFVPFTLIVFSLVGVLPARECVAQNDSWSRKYKLKVLTEGAIIRMPPILLCSLVCAAVIQVPNGLSEWLRVQSPKLSDQHLDEWSPAQLDWIHPERVVELATPFGGSRSVGWWFSYGNAIESLTGIENLLGTTGFETIRSAKQFALACEPLIESNKRFVVSIDGMSERLNACGIANVQALTSPNEDGLVVYEIRRK